MLRFLSLCMVGILLVWCSSTPKPDTTTQTWQTEQTQNNTDTTQTKKIVALWDSLTAWYQLPPEESYPSQLQAILQRQWYIYDIINWWNSWDTASQLKDRLTRSLEQVQAWDIALLVIWANDWLQWRDLQQMEDNIVAIINTLKQKELTVVLWGMQVPTNMGSDYTRDFRDAFPRIAEQTDVFFFPFFLEWVATIPELNLGDWIHPKKEWYAIIANNIATFLIENWIVTQ